jgi:hypothetical protein
MQTNLRSAAPKPPRTQFSALPAGKRTGSLAVKRNRNGRTSSCNPILAWQFPIYRMNGAEIRFTIHQNIHSVEL